MIGLRLSEDDIERVDRWAKERGMSRSDAIRALIEQALKK
jgi:predicted DNA binding CopG/RHH family protein